jgi:ribonuclease III
MVTGSNGPSNDFGVALPDAPDRVAAMEAKLGCSFNDRSLLLQALVHRSALLERQRDGVEMSGLASNERLEFLGDAVLSMLIAHYSYLSFPDYDEGRLTEVRAALVRRSTLGILAEQLGIGELVYMGRAERKQGGRGRATVLAEAFEALVAALFLDQGLASARQFVADLLDGQVPSLLERAGTLNAKSRLQELAQSNQWALPRYRLIQRTGPAHDSRFTVEVQAGDHGGTGAGPSRQAAEQRAAQELLTTLKCAFDGEPAKPNTE